MEIHNVNDELAKLKEFQNYKGNSPIGGGRGIIIVLFSDCCANYDCRIMTIDHPLGYSFRIIMYSFQMTTLRIILPPTG